ncbi:GNAT family N-acetyltransferase [Sandarakinorhabdus sp. AAP62]|uniref:GNAT family N-acetyltransferase n=1 Tax=Sandarakinorhabdus sp. AAP62 TaxID=1248916 RepID=UPI0003198B3A|nr:GNAT family N-acetyltransferase [Sandarakinorhabdus sp. AAP62]
MVVRLIPASPADLANPPPALLRGVEDFYPSAEIGLTTLDAIMAIMGATPRPPPWADWWALDSSGAMVGLCGFKAPPDPEGTVEIAYGSFPLVEGRGIATAMARDLVAIAAANGACTVIAHTLLPDNASAVVLRRNGFVTAGTVVDPEDGEVWAWRRPL